MKFFIVSEKVDDYINYIKKEKLDPLKCFYCLTKEEATKSNNGEGKIIIL
jgi:hypothetical protein